MTFARRLGDWYRKNKRDLPWRKTRDPYAIWISEIMLQQTRVSAVIPYYERFLKQFPGFVELAEASEQDLLAAWSGLGYYSRARNLQKAARQMVKLGGFPARYEEIRALPGVGDYTAGAVASIAFGLPYVGLDGNVIRVLARYFAEAGEVGNRQTRLRLAEFAAETLARENPGQHQQALMELGATICLPKAPKCLLCPVAEGCQGRLQGIAHQLPVQLKNQKVIEETRRLLIVQREGKILLWQRGAESRRLAGFWELPEPEMLPGFRSRELLGEFKHGIVNHSYRVQVEVGEWKKKVAPPLVWVGEEEAVRLPLSTMTRKSLQKLSLSNK